MADNLVAKIASSPHPYIIAEIGINHNGDMELARQMVDAAKEAGADCVKFQSFLADRYISERASKADYQQQDDTVQGKSQRQIIKECELSTEQAIDMKAYATEKQIDFLSTPFEVWSLRELQKIGVPGIKVSSCNLTNYPFLEELADSGLPVLLSTGMGALNEVARAVHIFQRSGSPLLLFQCTSNYPSRIENANLLVIPTYASLFGVPVGLSDHTTNHTTSIAAVALGAVAVEKHFTLSRDLPGIDQKASIEPQDLRGLVEATREAHVALGSPMKERTDEEENTAIALRRSLVAARDIKAGELCEPDMLAIKRPGTGLAVDHAERLAGARFARDVEGDQPITLDDFLEK